MKAHRVSNGLVTKNAGAVLYRHQSLRFAPLIPLHLDRHDGDYQGDTRKLPIGPVTLTLCVRSKTIKGPVPDSWLVDLNGETLEEPEEALQ